MRRLFGGLDSFGDDGNAEFVGKRDDRAGDRCVSRAQPETGHEEAVDLQRVDGKLPEVRQAGPPGAEVIDGDRHAEIADRVQAPRRLVEVLHE